MTYQSQHGDPLQPQPVNRWKHSFQD